VPTLLAVGVLLNISQQASGARDFGFSIFDLGFKEAGVSAAALSNQKSKVKNQKFA
jgi:hypothetical protein